MTDKPVHTKKPLARPSVVQIDFERADQREDLMEDLLQAREFQQRILTSPPDVPGICTEILYRPLDLVGGDLYQVFTLPDGVLRVFVADATGHGVKASLTTVLISSEYELVKDAVGAPAPAWKC